MEFVQNTVLAEFSKDAKFFICAINSKGPGQKVNDLRCFKDGINQKIDFGGSNEHLYIHGMNTEVGFRTLFDVTIFATSNNLIIMLFNLTGDGLFDRIIKLKNKFIKESIADISILTRGSFVVLGSKGYLGIYKKKYAVETESKPDRQLMPSSLIEQENFTFKIESQLDIKMTEHCRAICMDVTLDQNFITIVVYSAKKKSHLLLIVKIKSSKELIYLTHLNLSNIFRIFLTC